MLQECIDFILVVFWWVWLYGFGFFVGLVLLCIVGMLLNGDFVMIDNVMNVFICIVFIGIIVVGMCFVIISGGIDLFVGLMVVLIVGCVIWVMNYLGMCGLLLLLIVVLGVVFVVVFGVVFGFVYGLLIMCGCIEFFIVMLGILGIFCVYFIYLFNGGVIMFDDKLVDIYVLVYYGVLLGVLVLVWVFLVVVVLGVLLLNCIVYGCYVQVIGFNEQVVCYVVVDVDCIKLLIYVLLGVCVGIVILFYVLCLGLVLLIIGLLWELEVIVLVIVGGIVLKGGVGSIIGIVVGVVLFLVISNILNFISIISVYFNVVV